MIYAFERKKGIVTFASKNTDDVRDICYLQDKAMTHYHRLKYFRKIQMSYQRLDEKTLHLHKMFEMTVGIIGQMQFLLNKLFAYFHVSRIFKR